MEHTEGRSRFTIGNLVGLPAVRLYHGPFPIEHPDSRDLYHWNTGKWGRYYDLCFRPRPSRADVIHVLLSFFGLLYFLPFPLAR